jgi:hypothetical protein
MALETINASCSKGMLVCLGQDDVSDAYYPYGRSNMLEVALLAASHLLWMSGADEGVVAPWHPTRCPART